MLKLYNSLTNKLEEFIPLDPKEVKMYACGPTVYDSPHIGNARPMVIFDILFRLLKILYPKVIYVRNITDVDDKINARAHARQISIQELTNEIISEFNSDKNLLNILPVSFEPKATQHINEMLEIIDELISKDLAYVSHGHVLFRVKKISNYGMLSKRNLDEMIAGSRVEIAPYKEDPMDFVLWKPSKENEPEWSSKYGRGRPGWHLECSAMTHKYLGAQFDIHAGGQDLMFPHHENEIAQSFGAFGCLMARYWIHNAMVSVNGKKMSKSLGNIVSLKDSLKKYKGEVIRYALLTAHYQKTLDFSEELLRKSQKALDKFYNALSFSQKNQESDVDKRILDALCNNLNTPLALNELHSVTDQIFKASDESEIDNLCAKLKVSARIMGLLENSPSNWFKLGQKFSDEEIEKMLDERAAAKAQKDYKLADEIREKLLEAGIQIEDKKNGTTWKTARKQE